MKILTVRGKNLASIAGEFEIDFTCEPLHSAGIFAICGPTGAGKSTILDAICLALFNNTPRTTGTESVKMTDVGKEQILQGDKRQILRRGTTDGYAEVDFQGVDGKRYRSNWHVRRANNKLSGKLQPIELRVYDLSTNTEIASKISESENKLRELTGLTYEQFTRTVLLAQNEFARFLKARKEEKAEVLEKLTGTEIYSVISNTVYTKSTAAKAAWKQISDRLSAIHLLSTEEIGILSQKQKELEQREKETRETENITILKIKWCEEYTRLSQDVSQANISLRQAEQAAKDAQPETERIRLVESVGSASTLWQNKQKCRNDLESQQKICKQSQERLSTLVQTTAQINEQHSGHKQMLVKVTAGYDTLKPILKKAREMDVELKNARKNLTESVEKRDKTTEKRIIQEKTIAEKEKNIQNLSEQLVILENWFKKYQKYEQMCLDINLINGFLDSAYISAEQGREKEKLVSQLIQEQEAAVLLQNKQLEIQAEYQKKLSAKTEEKKYIQEKLTLLDISRIRNRRKELQGEKDSLQEMMGYLQEISRLQEETIRQQSLYQEKKESYISIQQQAAKNEKELETVAIQRDTSRRLYEKAQQAANENIIALRQHLTPGEPCPVCGSCEHPVTCEPREKEPALSLLKSEDEKYEASYQQLNNSYIRLTQDLTHTKESVLTLENDIILLQKQSEDVVANKIKNNSHNSDTKEQINHQLSVTLEQLTVLDREEEVYEQERRRFQEIDSQIEQLTLVNNQVNEELSKNQARLNELSAQILKENAVLDNFKQQAKEALEKIAEKIPVDNWRERWVTDNEQFRKDLSETAARWQSKQQEMVTIQSSLQQFETQLAEEKRILDTLCQNEKEVVSTFQQQTEVLAHLQAERTMLLDGKPADEAEQAYTQEIAYITEKLEQAAIEKDKITASYLQTQGEINQLQTAISKLELQYQDYQQQIDSWLRRYNTTAETILTEETLKQLLEISQEEIKAGREKLTTLHHQITVAQTTLQERSNQLTRHSQHPDKTDVSQENIEQLKLNTISLKQKIEELNHEKTEISVTLRNQQQNSGQAESLRLELEQQSYVMEQWGKLDDLIGSQSGYKFKEIAQGYTLDILLGYANKQLKELTARYKLQRVPNELALQIIDHDMCDEVRSVYSLSGGESFLVSLALALGLSSFSSQNHHEENLFIDEGFGTLDAETLQIVMEALERLRSQGRKVGVISHVREMAERIPVQIFINKSGNGKSKVKIVG